MPWLTIIEHDGTVWSGMNATREGSKTCILLPDSVIDVPEVLLEVQDGGGPDDLVEVELVDRKGLDQLPGLDLPSHGAGDYLLGYCGAHSYLRL